MQVHISPEDLLFSYYDLSFPVHLGIPFPGRSPHLQYYPNLRTFLNGEFSKVDMEMIQGRLRNYLQFVAPRVKMKPLIEYLNRQTSSHPRQIIDLGCGSAVSLETLIMLFTTIERAYCIDIDDEALRANHERFRTYEAQVIFGKSVEDVGVFEQSIDLCLAIHTFHHMQPSERENVMSKLVNSLKKSGIFYLYEDSWDKYDYGPIDAIDKLNKKFSGIPWQYVTSLFIENEYWSNEWCFERRLALDPHYYRKMDEWCSLVSQSGLQIVEKGSIGFNLERLHGVPSVWIVAQRSQ